MEGYGGGVQVSVGTSTGCNNMVTKISFERQRILERRKLQITLGNRPSTDMTEATDRLPPDNVPD